MKRKEDIAYRVQSANYEPRTIDSGAEKHVIYRPLSYYIAGGSDPTGQRLSETSEVGYDTDDPMDYGVACDGLCDPRTSMFDLIEQLGSQAVEKVEEYISARKNKPETQS